MRVTRSRFSLFVAGPLALLGLTACVPSATTSTKDTLAPLVVPAVATTIVAIDTTVASTPAAGPPPTSAVGASATTSSTPAAAAGTDVSTTTSTTTPPLATPGVYTVVARDTLSGIARRCSITPQALVDYNKWTDGLSHAIYPGTKVNLPCTPEGAVPSSETATSTTQPSATSTTVKSSSSTTSTTVVPGPGGLYTIVAGDYLAAIAAKNKTTVDAIIAVNGWADGVNHLIIPGQQIKLPAPTK